MFLLFEPQLIGSHAPRLHLSLSGVAFLLFDCRRLTQKLFFYVLCSVEQQFLLSKKVRGRGFRLDLEVSVKVDFVANEATASEQKVKERWLIFSETVEGSWTRSLQARTEGWIGVQGCQCVETDGTGWRLGTVETAARRRSSADMRRLQD
jgi:hypothetical protein